MGVFWYGDIFLMTYTHFIVSRLNLKFCNVLSDEKIMKYRVDLFEKTTYKSIKNQSDKNFIFLQIADSSIPNEIKKRQELLSTVLYLDSSKEENDIYHIDQPGEFLSRELGKINTDLVITTNIDSDDTLHKNYVQKINRIVETCDFQNNFPCLITSKTKYNFSLTHGLSKEIDSCISLCRGNMNSPQSMSFIESTKDNILSCFCSVHGLLPKYSKKQIKVDLPFIELFHDANVCQTHNDNIVNKIDNLWLNLNEEKLCEFFYNFSGVDYFELKNVLLSGKALRITGNEMRTNFINNWESLKKNGRLLIFNR